MAQSSLKKLLVNITAYYVIGIGLLAALITTAPRVAEYLPVGTASRIFAPPQGPGLGDALEQETRFNMDGLADGRITDDLIYLLLCFVSAIFVVIPVALVYLRIPGKKKPRPTIAKTIILLPIAITGLVLIVQNSLALAFSLAGMIAGAGIRFRTQLRAVSDTLFFLIAVGIGLASGVGAIGIAMMMSLIFCYTSIVIHSLEVGGQTAATDVSPPAPTPTPPEDNVA